MTAALIGAAFSLGFFGMGRLLEVPAHVIATIVNQSSGRL